MQVNFLSSSFYRPLFMSAEESMKLFSHFSIENSEVQYEDRFSPHMKMRLHALARSKSFFMNCGADEVLSYNYPGRTYASMLTYQQLKDDPVLEGLVNDLNTQYNCSNNFVICTSYKRKDDPKKDDFIAAHSDKDDNFKKGSGFFVLTLGTSQREFVVYKNQEEVFRVQTEPGSLLFMSSQDNKDYKHCVVRGCDEKMEKKGEVGLERVSLVFRSIAVSVPRSTVDIKVAQWKINVEKRALSRVNWWVTTSEPKIVHQDSMCVDRVGSEIVSVASAHMKRMCGSCFPFSAAGKKRKLL